MNLQTGNKLFGVFGATVVIQPVIFTYLIFFFETWSNSFLAPFDHVCFSLLLWASQSTFGFKFHITANYFPQWMSWCNCFPSVGAGSIILWLKVCLYTEKVSWTLRRSQIQSNTSEVLIIVTAALFHLAELQHNSWSEEGDTGRQGTSEVTWCISSILQQTYCYL